MNILIVNPFGIGDVLFATPMIQLLKESYPDSKIGFLCNKRTKPILETNPDIDKIYVYEKDDFRALWRESKLRCFRKLLGLLRKIKKDNYDIALDLSLALEYSFFLMLIGITTRIGYNYKNRGKFLTIKIDIDGYHEKHIIEYYLGLLKYLGVTPKVKALQIFTTDMDRKRAEEILLGSSIRQNKLLVGIIPGGGITWGERSGYKHWPAKYYAEVIDKLIEGHDAEIILFGSKKEREICKNVIKEVRHKENIFNMAGKTNLRTFAYLLSKCDLVICNDGGPLHIAVSQGVKTVSFFGPVNEKVYGPYPQNEDHVVITKDVSCRPCYYKFKTPRCDNRRCLTKIKPKEVMVVVEDVLGISRK